MAGKRKAAETSSRGPQQMGIAQALSRASRKSTAPARVNGTQQALQQEWLVDIIPASQLEDTFRDLGDHVREADKDMGVEPHNEPIQAPAAPVPRRTERGHKPNRRFNNETMVLDHTPLTSNPPEVANLRHKEEDTKKQERVLRDLEKLQHVFANSRSLPVMYQARLVELVHHPDHPSSDDIALAAFRVWQQRFQALPACKVSSGADGKPVLLVNRHCWTPIDDRASKTRAMMRLVAALETAEACVKRKSEEPAAKGKTTSSNTSLGSLLMLKLLLQLLQQDLLARLHVTCAHEDKKDEAAKLLSDSLLWRMFAMDDHGWRERENVMSLCVQIIVAGSDSNQGAWFSSNVVSRSQLVGLARTLLAMFYELYSAMEGLGQYSTSCKNTRGGSMKNDRYCMDRFMQELLVGTRAPVELKELEAKQLVLLSLPHRDCARFLAIILGLYDKLRPKHVEQTTHDARLEEFLEYWETSGRKADSFFWIDPVMVLQYIRQHWQWSKNAVFGGGLDSLLLFVSCLGTAASHCTQPGCAVDMAALAIELRALLDGMPELRQEVEGVSPNVRCQWLMVQEIACA